MTVSLELDAEKVALSIDGDLYLEHAECLRDMACYHASRGIRCFEFHFCQTYYVDAQSTACLRKMKQDFERNGICVAMSQTSGRLQHEFHFAG